MEVAKAKQSAARRRITTTVVASTETIDLTAWLEQYCAAIVEAEGHPIVSTPVAA